ncbi:MAG: GYD domain-containing protein [Myxococcota bacterium]
MPTYVLLSSLTPEGRMSLHKNPGRLEEVNHEIEQLGCRVVSQYALLGRFDFLTLVEAPDNEPIAHLSADLGLARDARGHGAARDSRGALRAALLAEDPIGRPAAGPIVSFRPLDGGPAPGGREIA